MMMSINQLTGPQIANSMAAMAGGSTGTTPSSLCSTPVTLLGQQQGLMPLIQQNHYAAALSQMQLPVQNAFEGMPIFVLPPNGVQHGVSAAALQRAVEAKTGIATGTAEPKVDTSKHHHIFIGDLSSEVDAKMIKDAFSPFGEVSEAKVIRDAQTQKSRGYGFVSFPDKENAESAMAGMNGKQLGRRQIRTNWATRRPSDEAKEKLTFEQVFNSTKPENTSVYVGNVCQSTTEAELRESFTRFGLIHEVRIFKTQGYAFVRFEKKQDATNAIMDMNGKAVGGNIVRCSWGRTQQQQQPTITPLLSDFNSLLAAQQLMQPTTAFGAPFAASALWNPLTAYAQPYINPMATLMPQW